MKILYNVGMHAKNEYALMNYKNITLCVINTTDIDKINVHEFDAIYSPSVPLDVTKYPTTKFIFGPHFSVFPNMQQIDMIRGSNSIYIQPSEWVSELWKNICDNMKINAIPFGVDTITFKEIKPIHIRNNIFIYYKRRHPAELNFLENFLKNKNITYTIFDYIKQYNENDYINYLQNSKFGIWLDAHESQGFALQEALACNVPLLVWNIQFMSQEYGSNYGNIPATTIPYWDERCGEYFYNSNELENAFNLFISKIETYKPREYIVENLSMDVCEKKFMDLIN